MTMLSSRFSTENRNLGVRWTPDRGWAVFAVRPIRKGVSLLTFRGPILPLDETPDLSHALQVDTDRWMGPSGGLDDLVNHSCRPSCGLRATNRGPSLVALQDLDPGAEVTFDYSTWRLDEPWEMHCRCATAECRGALGQFTDLPAELQVSYLKRGIVAPFIARAVRNTPRRPRRSA